MLMLEKTYEKFREKCIYDLNQIKKETKKKP